jgi:hypothetical protein
MKLNLKKQAINLRRQGYLFTEIASELQIARSTAHNWTYALILSNAEEKRLQLRTAALQHAKMVNLANLRRQHNLERERLLLERARAIVANIVDTEDHQKIMCAVFFWCEGTKDVSGGIKFTNADPIMVRKFLALLRASFEIDEKKFRALIHLHEYHNPSVQLKFWSGVTGIPHTQFHKSYIKPHTGKNRHAGYPGCLSLRYLDASLGKLLKMIYSEYGQHL